MTPPTASSNCTAGSFLGPTPPCTGGDNCVVCTQWRYGQCTVSHQVIYGLVFGLGGAVLLIFLGFVAYFTYKVCTRRDRYVVLG